MSRLSKPSKNLPEAYRIGDIPFLNTTIDLSLRPFIPRPETEYWVHEAMQTVPPKKRLRILDAFAGSGAIGIALLKNFPSARADFLEKNPALKKQVEINLARNGIKRFRAKIIIGTDIPRKKYDAIFANPPYIDRERKHTVEKSVLDHEPYSALFAKDRGMYYVKRLITLAPMHLSAGGKMWIEFGAGQKRTLEQYLRAISAKSGFAGSFRRDQYGKWRVLEISGRMNACPVPNRFIRILRSRMARTRTKRCSRPENASVYR